MDVMTKEEIWRKLHFGLFIHFGLYSIPGGVWNGEAVTRGYSEQILSQGDLDRTDYEALAGEFDPKNFDAYLIARTAKAAGMSYVVITTKHHDGFCLFDTETTDYNSRKSASRRDFVRELSDACRAEGLGLGLYFSWIDWHCPHALPISDHNSDRIPPEHHRYNLVQLTELLSNYGPICELWFDMGHPTREQSQEMANLVRRIQPGAMISGRIWNNQEDFYVMGDNEIPSFRMDRPWQTPASIYKETWGYRSWQERPDLDGKITELVRQLGTVSALGGNYLLNIGPRGDGSLVPFEADVLEGIGRWISINRDAVFGVRPGDWQDETWGCSTATDTALYLQLHRIPGNGLIVLEGFRETPVSVSLLGSPAVDIPFEAGEPGNLVINLTGLEMSSPLPVLRLLFPGGVPEKDGTVRIGSGDAVLLGGEKARLFQGEEYYTYKPGTESQSWSMSAGADGRLILSLPCRIGQEVSVRTGFPRIAGQTTEVLPDDLELTVRIDTEA